jgi:hypothetical protein
MQPTEPTVTDFDPATTCAIHDEMRPSWEMNRDFAEMLLPVLRQGRYLDEFGSGASREAPAQYRWRANASLALDHCADLINLRVDNIFRTPPVRRYADSPFRDFIEAFLDNVDGGGSSMDDLLRRALRLHYVNGVDFVVDRQAAPDGAEPMSLAQERQLGLLPYVHAFGPLDRPDWAVDHAGRFLWARYRLGEAPPVDEWSGPTGVTRYLTVTPHQWRLYEVSEDQDGPAQTTLRDGPLALGVCPIVPFYFKESARADAGKVPLSLLTRIAPIARYLLNLVSQVQIDVYRNIAFLVATGVDAERVPTEITPMGCWALPEGAELRDVAGDVRHVEVKLALARTLMEAILRIGKLTGSTGDLKSRAASGTQVAVERTDLDNEMSMTAAQLERVERQIVRLAVSRYEGRLVEPAELRYSVEFNRKYVLTPVGELVAQVREFVGAGVHDRTPTLLRVLLRKLLDTLTKEDDDAYRVALNEIDQAIFASPTAAD